MPRRITVENPARNIGFGGRLHGFEPNRHATQGRLSMGQDGSMTSASQAASPASGGTRKLAALLLALAAVGLPVNQLEAYALLLVAAVVIFSGEVRASAGAWAAAVAIVALAAAGQSLLAPPRIEEGHNVFLPGGPSDALKRGLPAEVYGHMANEFDALYPPVVRCRPGSIGCWQDGGFPDSVVAFSADGIFHKIPLSRSVTELDFSDPVWLRLGFTNELRYNWYTAAPDVHRADRDRRFWMGLQRWHLAMPWFEMIRLPAAFVGGELCWRGEVMWESAGEHFALWPGDGCRAIEPADAGRRIFGIAIKPDTLTMRLTPPWTVRLQQFRRRRLGSGRGNRRDHRAGAFPGAAHDPAVRSDWSRDPGGRDRRCQLPRRCTALRRRRRWAVL